MQTKRKTKANLTRYQKADFAFTMVLVWQDATGLIGPRRSNHKYAVNDLSNNEAIPTNSISPTASSSMAAKYPARVDDLILILLIDQI